MTYRDDTTPDDIQPGHQVSMKCECGHLSYMAWRLLPRDQQFTPFKDLWPKMCCKRCGRRRPVVIINGVGGPGGEVMEFWRFPTGVEPGDEV